MAVHQISLRNHKWYFVHSTLWSTRPFSTKTPLVLVWHYFGVNYSSRRLDLFFSNGVYENGKVYTNEFKAVSLMSDYHVSLGSFV